MVVLGIVFCCSGSVFSCITLRFTFAAPGICFLTIYCVAVYFCCSAQRSAEQRSAAQRIHERSAAIKRIAAQARVQAQAQAHSQAQVQAHAQARARARGEAPCPILPRLRAALAGRNVDDDLILCCRATKKDALSGRKTVRSPTDQWGT